LFTSNCRGWDFEQMGIVCQFWNFGFETWKLFDIGFLFFGISIN